MKVDHDIVLQADCVGRKPMGTVVLKIILTAVHLDMPIECVPTAPPEVRTEHVREISVGKTAKVAATNSIVRNGK